MVIRHHERRAVRIAHPTHGAIFAVVGDAPETGLGCDERLVTVIVIGKGLGRMGEVDLVGHGRNKVFGFVTVRGGLIERRVGLKIGEAAGR